MAATYLAETPSRVLRRVQLLENIELPSLPSIQHDDYENTSVSELDSSADDAMPATTASKTESKDSTTSHPLKWEPARRLKDSHTVTTNESSSSTSGSPFPPVDFGGSDENASLYASTYAMTSTPLSRPARSQSRSLVGGRQPSIGQEPSRVTSGRPDSSIATGGEDWQTPGAVSGRFSGDDLLPEPEEPWMRDPGAELEGDRSTPLKDHSKISPTTRAHSIVGTPITQRLAAGNVVLQRPGRRSASNQYLPMLRPVKLDPSGVSPVTASSMSMRTPLTLLDNERIPSLTRSELSGSDSSHAASTPEGPSRILGPAQASPTQDGGRDASSYQEQTWDSLPVLPEESAYEHDHGSLSSDGVVQIENAPRTPLYASPAKGNEPSTVKVSTSTSASTPGVDRRGSVHGERIGSTPLGIAAFALSDITDSHQDSPMSAPFTPSPTSLISKGGCLSTPRAPLDDAERRKNHVLAVLSSSGLSLRTPKAAFRGTPHPLRRVTMATSPSLLSEGENAAKVGDDLENKSTPLPHMTIDISQVSSLDESLVSIASSADLTSDRRAASKGHSLSRGNMSFPNSLLPSAGTSSPGGGSLRGLSDQRPDGVKIQRHLNAMNRQLLDDNAGLAREVDAWRLETGRLRRLLRDANVPFEDMDISAQLAGLDGPLAGRTVERSIRDDQLAALPTLMEEGIFDKQAESLQESVGRLGHREEQNLGSRTAESEAEPSAARPSSPDPQLRVEGLQSKLEEAESVRIQLQTDFALKTEKHARQFGDICGDFENQVKSLEGELATTKADVARLRAEKAALQTGNVDSERIEWQQQIASLGIALSRAKEEVKSRIHEVEQLKGLLTRARDEKSDIIQRAEKAEDENKAHSDRWSASEQRARSAERRVVELETDCNEAQSIRNRLAVKEEELEQFRQLSAQQEAKLASQYEQIEELVLRVGHMEIELEQKSIQASLGAEVDRLQELLSEANSELAQAQGDIESLRNQLSVAEATALCRHSESLPKSSPNRRDLRSISTDDTLLTALQDRLDEAYHEIGRLKHELAGTPHRKTVIEVRDARIQALEREKAALLERIAAKAQSPITGMPSAASPFKSTPFFNKTIATLKPPKTPATLKDLSWLNSTYTESKEPILRAQLEQLEEELANANDQLDENFSRLEAAGIGGLQLAENLAAARDRIEQLEDELRGLSQRNKASLALVSAQRKENGQATNKLTEAMAEVHKQMGALKTDFAKEKTRLQQDNERLSQKMSDIKRLAQEDSASLASELRHLRMKSERELRESEKVRVHISREKDILQIQLQNSTRQLHQLEADLAVQQAAYAEFAQHHTKHSREPSSSTLAELETKSETIRNLEDSLREAVFENDRLRARLRTKTDGLQRAEEEVKQLQTERTNVMRELLEFDVDLKAQRAAATRFGADLATFKAEHDSKATRREAELLQAQRQSRSLKMDLEQVHQELKRVRGEFEGLARWRASHDCQSGLQDQLDEKELTSKAQIRELATQIRYLKAKFTREATFRNALALQKRYLLLLVGGMSLTEQATLKQIASMGFPVPSPPRNSHTLKAAALAVVALIRARNIAMQWKAEVAVKSKLMSSRNERKLLSQG